MMAAGRVESCATCPICAGRLEVRRTLRQICRVNVVVDFVAGFGAEVANDGDSTQVDALDERIVCENGHTSTDMERHLGCVAEGYHVD